MYFKRFRSLVFKMTPGLVVLNKYKIFYFYLGYNNGMRMGNYPVCNSSIEIA